MNTPFISVIIPTFNRKTLCKKAITSVLNQTYTNYELLVIDDCSTDGTSLDILFGGKGNRKHCRYFSLPCNTGVAYARNYGVAQAEGAWVAFLDSDDEWHPKKIAKQTAWIRTHPECNIVQTKEIWIRKGKRVNPPKTHEKIAGDIFKESLERCMITPSSVMIKRDFFMAVGKFNESLPACEDYDLWLRITLNHPVGLVDEYLLTRHGGREDQLSYYIGILDKFRVRSLLQILAHEHPDSEQQQLIYTTLVRKAEIVANGAKKRNKVNEYERFTTIANLYRKFL